MRDTTWDAAAELNTMLRKHVTVPDHVNWEWEFQYFDQSFVVAAYLKADKDVFRNTRVYLHEFVRKPELIVAQLQSMIDDLPSGLTTEQR